MPRSRIRSSLETLGFVVLIAGLVAVMWFGSQLTLTNQLVLGGLLLTALALLIGSGWVKLFGPVLFYDLVRTSRRGRYYLIRTFYVSFLAFLLCWIYLTWVMEYGANIRATEMAVFAESFFGTFVAVQFLTVAMLTPAYTAGAIAEEKDRKTLEFLLATDLRNREIVLSKLVSRLLNLGFLVLSGLPVLSFLQFLGGVDPELVLASFAATGITIVSLASLSIFSSVLARKPRDAIVLTYVAVLTYLAVSGLSWSLVLIPGWATFPSSYYWDSPVTLRDLVEWSNAGNIVSALTRVFQSGFGSGSILLEVLRDYVIFHALFALLCTVAAVRLLRPLALQQASPAAPGRKSLRMRFRWRPAVGNHPMIWKEVFSEPARVGWFMRGLMILLVLASFVPAVWIAGYVIWEFLEGSFRGSQWKEIAQAFGWWARIVGAIVGCLTLLGVAVRAAGSVSGERDKQTLDELLTTPLSSSSILFGKWIGSILSVRWGWLWMGMILGVGVVTTGVHFLAVPLWIVAWFSYATFLAGLGLWFSTVSRTTLRATLYTMVGAAFAGFGHWLIWMCCTPIFIALGDNPGQEIEWVLWFQAFGLTPPLTLGFLAFNGWEFDTSYVRQMDEAVFMLISSLVGVTLYALGGVVLWVAANERFRRLSGRLPLARPRHSSFPTSKTVSVKEEEPILDAVEWIDDEKPERPSDLRSEPET